MDNAIVWLKIGRKHIFNNNYLYSALSCVTQSAVTPNEWNTILQGKEMVEFESEKFKLY